MRTRSLLFVPMCVMSGVFVCSMADAPTQIEPTVFFGIPGVPVLVPIPSITMTGTQAQWVFWGWRPFVPSQQVVTGSDG